MSASSTSAVAYQVAELKEGESLSLQRRDDYWGDKPDVEDITLQYFDDPNALNDALRTGDIDVISNVQAPESLSAFSNEVKYRITEGSTNGEVVMAFNHSSEPLKDLKVRQAIKYALDRREIRDVAWDSRGQLIGSMVPPTEVKVPRTSSSGIRFATLPRPTPRSVATRPLRVGLSLTVKSAWARPKRSVNGPFSADFKWATLPDVQATPIRFTDGQAKVFEALWSFKGAEVDGERIMQRAGQKSDKPIDLFKIKSRDKGKPEYEARLAAYVALVVTQQRAGLYSMPCAAAVLA